VYKMSEKGNIQINIEDDAVTFSTNLSVAEMNFWLDHIKYLIISGQAKITNE